MMLKRALSLVAVLALGAICSAAPIKFKVFVGTEKVGSLVLETTGDDASGYTEDSTFTLTKDSHKLTINEIVHYGKDGVVTSKTSTVTKEGHEVRFKAKLSDDGAKVAITDDNDTGDEVFPLATKVSRADLTNFWFKTITPEVGAKVTYQFFDILSLEWSDVNLTYKGKNKVKIGDHEVEGYEVERTQGETKSTFVLDDHGDLLAEIADDMRFERE